MDNNTLPHTGIGRETFEYKGFRVIVHKARTTNNKLEQRDGFEGVITGHNRRHRVFADTPEDAAEQARQWVNCLEKSDDMPESEQSILARIGKLAIEFEKASTAFLEAVRLADATRHSDQPRSYEAERLALAKANDEVRSACQAFLNNRTESHHP